MYDRKPIQSSSIVFIGDSLTESFDLNGYFGRADLRNRGISGNTTEHVLYRLEEVILAKPGKVFLMIGINDLFEGQTSSKVFENISSVFDRLEAGTPATQLYLQSVLPVNENKIMGIRNLNVLVYDLNDRLRRMGIDRDIIFIDLHSHFLNHEGQMDSSFTQDGVHLTPEGYQLWAELLKDYL